EGSGSNKAFQLPDGLVTLGWQAFQDAFAQDVTVTVPAGVKNMGSQALYSSRITLIYMAIETVPGEDEWASASASEVWAGQVFSTSALRVDQDTPVIFKTKELRDTFYDHHTVGNFIRDNFTYPVEVAFTAEAGDITQTDWDHSEWK